MRGRFHRGGRRRGGTLIMFMFMLPTLLVPLVGLAVDGSRVYIVQAKLAGAVDGAALGAGRLLGTSADTAEIAGEFLNANFPTGFWNTAHFHRDIQFEKTFIMNKITVSATVDVPLLFTRIFGQYYATVAASAIATRKETRVELVIDRSGTMSGELTSVQQTATQFTKSFIPGYDQMGLVVFSGSGVVGYPTTRPYNYSPTSAGGPDNSFQTPPSGGGSDMVDMIAAIKSGGFTNMSEGLALAYLELQKADHRDQDATRLNAIVLFTDGFPNSFSAYLNDPSNLPTSNSLKACNASHGVCQLCKCTNNPATATDATTQMVGWMSGGNTSGQTAGGPYFLASSDSHSADYWMAYSGTPDQQLGTGNLSTAVAKCTYLASTTLNDLRQIPPLTYWGDSTGGTAFNQSGSYKSKSYDSTTPTDSLNVGIAGWNATDSVGLRILNDTNLNVTIYVIGYVGTGGNPDAYLLKRLANTKDSSRYSTSWQVGQYVEAKDTSGLAQAFQSVAASILRLAQ